MVQKADEKPGWKATTFQKQTRKINVDILKSSKKRNIWQYLGEAYSDIEPLFSLFLVYLFHINSCQPSIYTKFLVNSCQNVNLHFYSHLM